MLNIDLNILRVIMISKGANISVFWGNRYYTLELRFK